MGLLYGVNCDIVILKAICLDGETRMSKYNPLWKYIQKNGGPQIKLTFDEVKDILGLRSTIPF